MSHMISTLVECCNHLITYGMSPCLYIHWKCSHIKLLESEHLYLVWVRYVSSLQETVIYTRKASFALVKTVQSNSKHLPKVSHHHINLHWLTLHIWPIFTAQALLEEIELDQRWWQEYALNLSHSFAYLCIPIALSKPCLIIVGIADFS